MFFGLGTRITGGGILVRGATRYIIFSSHEKEGVFRWGRGGCTDFGNIGSFPQSSFKSRIDSRLSGTNIAGRNPK